MWSREELERFPRSIVSKGSRLKPAVSRVELPEGVAYVKDVRDLPAAGRPLARWLMRREVRALERCEGIAGVPRVLGRIDRNAWAISTMHGRTLEMWKFRRAPHTAARGLQELTRRIHERGVYHLDLRQRKNVIIDNQMRIGFVDFGAGVALGRLLDPILGPLLAFVDNQATLKYIALWAPEVMSLDSARAFMRGQRLRRLWIFKRHVHNPEIEEVEAMLKRFIETGQPPTETRKVVAARRRRLRG